MLEKKNWKKIRGKKLNMTQYSILGKMFTQVNFTY